jgi:hypothetical protein
MVYFFLKQEINCSSQKLLRSRQFRCCYPEAADFPFLGLLSSTGAEWSLCVMNQQCRSHLPCNSRACSNSLHPPFSMLTPVFCLHCYSSLPVYRKKRFRSRFARRSSWWPLWVGRQLAPGSIASFFPLPLALSRGLPIGAGHHQGIETWQGDEGNMRGSVNYQITGVHVEGRTIEEAGERIKGPSLVYSGLDILPMEQSRGIQSSEKYAMWQPEGRGTWCQWRRNPHSLRGTRVSTSR